MRKRIISCVLALVLALSFSFALTGCSEAVEVVEEVSEVIETIIA